MRHIFTLVLFLLALGGLSAQAVLDNNILVHFSYGSQVAYGDLADRFGGNGTVHIGIDYITPKNFIFGIAGHFHFGSEVKEDILAPLRTSDGFIVGNDKTPADIQLRRRGFYTSGLVGYLLDFNPSAAKTGLRITLGAGLLQHKIRIQDDPSRVVPQLLDDYRQGYDRLANGLAFDQFIGLQHNNASGNFNFMIGFTALQGFTRNRRNWDFDLMQANPQDRFDVLIGGQLTWTLPFSLKGKSGEDIIY